MLDVLLLWPKSDAGVPEELLSKLLVVLKEAAGLRRLRVSQGDLMARGGPPPYSKVVEASFESLGDWMAVVDRLNSEPELAESDRVLPLVIFFDTRDA